ncbi:TssN family type VI secretion system protein [Zobellia russellii]|uniref:TssN family type VI secretion system protein n=1 Tax=Zobellia russellii TaxID=248907 RepID=UPI0037DD93A4
MIGSYLKRFINIEALIPFAIVLVFILLALGLIGRKTPGFKKRRKKYYYYLAALIAVMGIFLAIIYNLRQSTVMFRYFWMLAFATIIGGLHVFFYRYLFDKFDSNQGLKELLFGIITSFAIMVPVIMIAAHYQDLQYLSYYFLTMAAFTVPTSFFVLYKYSVSIPVKLYTKWYYPLQKKYDTPEHYELKNMIILNFMFYKNTEAGNMTSFKAKAPKNMEFGRLFYFFINDYNAKKATTKIELTDTADDPHGWYFYSKPKWYGASKHIDSELTVEDNNLKDGDVVICQRI